MCRSKDQGGRRCTGRHTRHPTPAPRMGGGPLPIPAEITAAGAAFAPTPAPRMDTRPASVAPSSPLSAQQKQPTPAPRLDPVPPGEPHQKAEVSPPVPKSPEDAHTAAAPIPAGTRVRALYRDLAATSPGGWVHLSELRSRLGDLPKAEFDAAVTLLNRDCDASVSPDSNQRGLTAADRAAAVRIGGEDRHMIRITEGN